MDNTIHTTGKRRTGLTQAVLRAAQQIQGIEVSEVPGFDLQAVSATCSRLAQTGQLHKVRAAGQRNRYFVHQQHAEAWMTAGCPAMLASPQATVDIGDTGAGRAVAGPRINRIGSTPDRLRPRRPDELPFVHRPGSQDANAHPSRFGNLLVYRDGRTEAVAHAACASNGA